MPLNLVEVGGSPTAVGFAISLMASTELPQEKEYHFPLDGYRKTKPASD